MQHYIKCLVIRIPIGIASYPTPTFYRELTKRNITTGNIEVYTRECIYWLDSVVYTDKQLTWLGDIKTKIQRVLPEAEIVEYQADAKYIVSSGKVLSLKSLQQIWARKITPKKRKRLQSIKLPSLVPLSSGKYEYQLYKALCRYGTRLHYERLLQFEYLFRAAKLYNQHSEEKLLPKKLLKLTHKAFDYIAKEIEKNPDGFKQKLEEKELREVRIKNALKLQAGNKQTRKENITKVKTAIASGLHYKSDGVTLNVTSLAINTSLTRVTINRILKIDHKSV